ncbi:chemotaxis protein CheV, partial [Pseudomonas syringae pv. tagetis]
MAVIIQTVEQRTQQERENRLENQMILLAGRHLFAINE